MSLKFAAMAAVACAASFLIVGSAAAQGGDTWTGAYAGLNAGGGVGTTTATEYSGPADYGEYSISEGAAVIGGQAGYNHRIGSATVVGVEGDIGWSSFDADRDFYSGGDYTNSAEWGAFGTLRARAGVAVDDTLFFVTAGLALVDVEYKFGDTTDPSNIEKESGLELGIAAGAGVEFNVADNISIKTEYLYIGLASNEVSDFGGDTGDFVSSAHLARVGVNFKF